MGEYGLRNKRELWRVQMALSKIRQAARTLLTLDDKDTKRLFEGTALMRRMYKYGLLEETQDKLDYVLALLPQDFLERRLQTLVFKLGLAKSIHHARVLIRQRHIRYCLQPISAIMERMGRKGAISSAARAAKAGIVAACSPDMAQNRGALSGAIGEPNYVCAKVGTCTVVFGQICS